MMNTTACIPACRPIRFALYMALGSVVLIGCRPGPTVTPAAPVHEDARNGGALFYEGVKLEQDGKPADAEDRYRKALRAQPDLEEAAQNLAALLIDRGAYADAIDVSRTALQWHSASAPLTLNLAIALASVGDSSGAIPVFDEAIRKAPVDPTMRLTFGHWLAFSNQKKRAVVELRFAESLAHDNPAILGAVGHELRLAAAFTECIEVFGHALRVKEASEFFTEQGLCRIGLDDTHEAEADFRRAISFDPKYAPAHFYLAGRLAVAARWREAAAEYKEYLKLAPNGSLAAAATERLRRVNEKATQTIR